MNNETNFALPRKNLMLMAIGFAIIVIGFLFMVGGGPENGVWNPEIFSFKRIVLAPVIVLFGFILEVFAILWIPKSKKEE
ncbi:MAG: DUF3098 domain-containing protein [Dysgonamonadaceae bacterium]|jgi:uncharacterized membrane protein YidH (DUF202 family)|nr:DUF3098 domain-containing protein [Dysgonamonadaceae bacterium]